MRALLKNHLECSVLIRWVFEWYWVVSFFHRVGFAIRGQFFKQIVPERFGRFGVSPIFNENHNVVLRYDILVEVSFGQPKKAVVSLLRKGLLFITLQSFWPVVFQLIPKFGLPFFLFFLGKLTIVVTVFQDQIMDIIWTHISLQWA